MKRAVRWALVSVGLAGVVTAMSAATGGHARRADVGGRGLRRPPTSSVGLRWNGEDGSQEGDTK